MRIPSWLMRGRQAPRTVAGLALGTEGADWVVMTGSPSAPDGLCCAERLPVPPWLLDGSEIVDAQGLGVWLRAYVQDRDHQVDGVFLSVDTAWVSEYLIPLPQALQGDDLHFQLMAELQTLWPGPLADVCVAYEPADVVASAEGRSALRNYRVGVIARAHVLALEQVAHAAGLRVLAIEPSAHAVQRTQMPERLSALPVASTALGLQCEVALGLALGAWFPGTLSFSPSRAQRAQYRRHAWWTRMATGAGAGALLGCALAVCLSWFTAWQDGGADATEVAQALQMAKQTEAAVQAEWLQSQALTDWLRTQASLQQHTMQWSRVLAQEARGVWVSGVQQQDGHWVVQGEALSSAHVHHLLQQLKALDIWAQAPHAMRMQFTRAASSRVMSTWQFRIEADLKASL